MHFGLAIVGALQFAVRAALHRGDPVLRMTDGADGVRREVEKKGPEFRNRVADEASTKAG